MSTSTVVRRFQGTALGQYLLGGVGGGLLGGIAMGLLLHLAGENTIVLIGAMYGAPSVVAGWLAHLFNSVVFGLIFVTVVRVPFVRDFASTFGGCVALGLVYGALLEVVSGGVVLPMAISLTGMEQVPFPALTQDLAGAVALAIIAAVAHLLYGALLGTVYAAVRENVVPYP